MKRGIDVDELRRSVRTSFSSIAPGDADAVDLAQIGSSAGGDAADGRGRRGSPSEAGRLDQRRRAFALGELLEISTPWHLSESSFLSFQTRAISEREEGTRRIEGQRKELEAVIALGQLNPSLLRPV